MASSVRLTVTAVFSLVLWGCQVSKDLVASSYGDYDPNNPPVVRNIDGSLSITDPSMFFWRGTTYVFSSGTGGFGVDVHTSKDLKTFEKQDRPLLSPNPPWVEKYLPNVTNLWSPCVLAWNGTIHMYFAASWFAATTGCIGHASTPSLDEPFVPDPEPLICSNLSTVDPYVAIDPAVILDGAGVPWMTFGSWGNGINIVALDRQGGRVDPKSSPNVIAARAPGDTEAIQAASLYRWRDFYYLFVSFDYSPNHILRVGRATQVTGPYVDREGKPMTTGGGSLVLQGDEFFKGPGSNMVFDDGKQRLNVYHAYNATEDVVLRLGELVFDQDGWPFSAGP